MEGKIYILEDDAGISGLIKVALEMNGLTVKAFGSVKEFEEAFGNEVPDLALLDIMLPDGSGLDALKYIKSKNAEVPCIMLSALGKEEDRVNGLNTGADDYITKPFSVLELTARVNARLRGNRKKTLLTVKNVTLDTETFAVTVDGETVTLNKKEFELLKTLMLNTGKVMTREKLLSSVWGYDDGETRTLDNHVARLRKLGIGIETVFGVGYRF